MTPQPLYLIHATAYAEWHLGTLRPAPPAFREQFREASHATLMVPDGPEEPIDIGTYRRIMPILDDPTKTQRTAYWMAGTQYHIYAITPDAADEIRHLSATVRHERLAQERADTAAHPQWQRTIGVRICPACGTYCDGDCGAYHGR